MHSKFHKILYIVSVKKLIILLLIPVFSFGQIAMPIDFENNQIATADFVNFDGGVGSVIDNPYITTQNLSSKIGMIVRDQGTEWAGSYIELTNHIDFSEYSNITMNVYSPYVGLMVKLKLEGDNGAFPSEPATERDAYTTISNGWETLTWSFSGEPSETYRKLVLMFDFGNIGDGTSSSTFYFDDISQQDSFGGLNQIDLPVTFEDSEIYYSLIDFEGNGPSTIQETTNGNYARVEKNITAGTSAGVTIGTEEGFASNIPITNADTNMYAHIYVNGTSQTGIPIRLKIEDSNDPTKSVETEAFTTVANEWEILEFDFSNEATGTAVLNTDYTFNMASIFFNFGSPGNNDIVYFFDNVSFSAPISLGLENQAIFNYKIYPNPTSGLINIQGNTSELRITVFDILGKELINRHVSDKLDIGSLEKGIYIMNLYDGVSTSKYKIIKN